jgi:hypothetical protein
VIAKFLLHPGIERDAEAFQAYRNFIRFLAEDVHHRFVYVQGSFALRRWSSGDDSFWRVWQRIDPDEFARRSIGNVKSGGKFRISF